MAGRFVKHEKQKTIRHIDGTVLCVLLQNDFENRACLWFHLVYKVEPNLMLRILGFLVKVRWVELGGTL